jgi:zinc transporter 1
LIALCLSIVLEAITRLIDPPVINNAKLILIVGSLGLASNLAGFFVLGGHGHSHGPDEHEHSHDEIRAAEEGHSHGETTNTRGTEEGTIEEGGAGEVFPEAILAKVKSKANQNARLIKSNEDGSTSRETGDSLNRSTSRSSSRRLRRYNKIEDMSIHPASFRQDIIAASRPQLDSIESADNTESEPDAADEDVPTEDSPLITKSNGKSHGHSDHSCQARPRKDSWHTGHHHNEPKKPSKGGHSHADMGMNAMILHVIGDALGNIGVIVSALIIWLTTWSGRYYADPAVSLFITLIILRSTVPLTAATAKILLQATPDHIEVKDIKEDIEDIPGVVSCHHMHIWQLSDTQIVSSMHIQVSFPIGEANGERYMEVAKAVRKCLHAHGIHSATIQPEFCLDKDHDHAPKQAVGLDGIVGRAEQQDAGQCFLECVDNCEGKSCCTPASAGSQHIHSDDDDNFH